VTAIDPDNPTQIRPEPTGIRSESLRTPALESYLRDRRQEIEHHLDQLLHPEPDIPPSLLEAMRYSVLAPGKRLRPLLVVLAAEVCARQEQAESPWPAACAVELIHAYSLIHDDLPAMDDDDLRRGQPTCHKKFGEALAILAGDALQALAFQTLAEGYPPALAGSCCGVLARAAGAAGMVGGQVEDLAGEQLQGSTERTLAVLEGVHLRKTGALIQAACVLGGLVGAMNEKNRLEALRGFGRCLGLAFQVVDDLLDVEGNCDQTGKRVGKDAARGKLTYPGLLGVGRSRELARSLAQEARDHLAHLRLPHNGTPVARLDDLVTLVVAREN
jgi:geranylgeranyl diphosphate synthase type II